MGLGLIFCGTAEFAVPSLRALRASAHRVQAIITAPDRPAGRGRRLRASPVAKAAGGALPVLRPPSINAAETLDALRAHAPDVLVVVAYGQVLSAEALGVPRLGAVNLHASLLPRHRGASPVAAAILAGDDETGVTTLWMTPALDAGDIILQYRVAIGPEETAGELEARLAAHGAELLVETLDRVADGSAPRRPQPAEGATYAGRLHPADFAIDWTAPAEPIVRRIRAGAPRRPAWTQFRGQRLQVLRAGAVLGQSKGSAGEVVGLEKETIVVCAGMGAVALAQVRPAGGRVMSAGEFARGRRIQAGERMGSPDGGAA